MKFRTTVSVLGLLIGLGAECLAAPEKPLDITQFMREQAASTRAAEARKTKPAAKPVAKSAAKPVAKPHQQPASRAAAAKPAAAPPAAALLPEAATAFAAPMPVPAASPFPPPPKPETVGAAVATEPNVQLVDAAELNDIDRKAEAAPSRLVSTPTPVVSTSWLQAIWAAVGNLFAALVTAVHQLFRF